MNPAESHALLQRAVEERFGISLEVPPVAANADELARILGHRSHRTYAHKPVDEALLRLLCACALSAPSKSDLQQADIVRVRDPLKRSAIAALLAEMPWVQSAPAFLVFCGNGRRIRQISRMRGKLFANDHLDAFMNAAVDAAIVMMNFIRAATAVGLGCCPISAIRDHIDAVTSLLQLPPCVFPLAGLCVGYPAEPGSITPRLPLSVSLHEDRFDETEIEQHIAAYDRRRHAQRPLTRQRYVELYGRAEFYGWSEDKARQYSRPQRADFGRFIRAHGFKLD
jgi:nitroreductase